MIPIGSIFPIGGGAGVVYLMSGFSTEEAKVAFICPRALRVKAINMAATAAPGVGESFTYMLRKGNVPGTVFADTGLQVVISDSEVADQADGAIDFARGERVDVKLTKTTGVLSGHHNGGLEIEFL